MVEVAEKLLQLQEEDPSSVEQNDEKNASQVNLQEAVKPISNAAMRNEEQQRIENIIQEQKAYLHSLRNWQLPQMPRPPQNYETFFQ